VTPKGGAASLEASGANQGEGDLALALELLSQQRRDSVSERVAGDDGHFRVVGGHHCAVEKAVCRREFDAPK
jgi:hypothetical protein